MMYDLGVPHPLDITIHFLLCAFSDDLSIFLSGTGCFLLLFTLLVMGKTDTCAADGCNHTSRGFCSFYYFPTHNPWRSLWIEAVGRKPVIVAGIPTPWEPTSWDRLCSCHFSNPPNPKSRRLDAKWVVPDLFAHSHLDEPSSFSSVSKALVEITQTRSGIPDKNCDQYPPTKENLTSESTIADKQNISLGKESTCASSSAQTQTLAEILSSKPQETHSSVGKLATKTKDSNAPSTLDLEKNVPFEAYTVSMSSILCQHGWAFFVQKGIIVKFFIP